MRTTVKVIIFDVGGVLINETMDVCLKYAAETLGIPPKKLQSTLSDKEIAALQTGKENDIEFWQRICWQFDIPCPGEKTLTDLWEKPYAKNSRRNPGTVYLAKKLKRHYPVGILSNTIKAHADLNRARGLYDGFYPVILSNEIGFRKPQKQIFELASEKIGILPENLVFIDDSSRWVKSARAAGLNAICFRSIDQLEKKLKLLGVII